jgi:hypothetical protein
VDRIHHRRENDRISARSDLRDSEYRSGSNRALRQVANLKTLTGCDVRTAVRDLQKDNAVTSYIEFLNGGTFEPVGRHTQMMFFRMGASIA